jgi:uncharacterized integral membrane protein
LYRIFFIIVIVLAVAVGLLVGSLNSDAVPIDLLWVQFEWPLGLLILSIFAAGLLMGLCLAWFFSILPLRIQLRKIQNSSLTPSSQSLKDRNV